MKKILMIGGETNTRAMLKASLEEPGHRVSMAITRKYTNSWLAHRLKPFDLIIYDTTEAPQAEPFWTELRQSAGTTPILILTSVFDNTPWSSYRMDRVMRRPFTIGDVVKAADQLLSAQH